MSQNEKKRALFEAGDRLLEAQGCYVVDVDIESSRSRPLLRFFIDAPDRTVTIDDCANASRAFQRHFDETGMFGGDYALEVSSPGLERRLARARDFERFAGREVRLRTREPVGGRRNFEGTVASADGLEVVLLMGETKQGFRYEAIARASLKYDYAGANRKENKSPACKE
jgi:ribosome maturation factor RimP